MTAISHKKLLFIKQKLFILHYPNLYEANAF